MDIRHACRRVKSFKESFAVVKRPKLLHIDQTDSHVKLSLCTERAVDQQLAVEIALSVKSARDYVCSQQRTFKYGNAIISS